MLSNFGNTISSLRKSKNWTQTVFAEKIGVTPQAISKWERGKGYPDITMIPVIARVFGVPVGVLLDGNGNTAIRKEMTREKFCVEFSECKNVMVYVGNPCKIELIRDNNNPGKIVATGDSVFLQHIDAEVVLYSDLEGYTLDLTIKNPSGSWSEWKDYDRGGCTNENYVQVFVKDDINFFTGNYLKFKTVTGTNVKGNHEEVFTNR
ncbi:MAG: helix-turn-helix transcriptional regulator [Clostridia bacterium]|nr:helix-turn-helix transcriptional regulator [Clostridia bacterium]